jgi:hypothetical protein
VIVDNDSSEGSCELLLQQPDVDVYHAAGSYAEANGGTLWLDPLMYERQEASGCCMSMPTNSSSMTQCEKYPLPRPVEHLEAVDHTRRLAPMTDLYRHPDRSPDLFFDGVLEHHQKSDRGSHIEGSPMPHGGSAQPRCLSLPDQVSARPVRAPPTPTTIFHIRQEQPRSDIRAIAASETGLAFQD